MVNPAHARKSKELDDNSPTKNDKKDAMVIAKLVIDGRYSEPHILEGIYAELRLAMNYRNRLVFLFYAKVNQSLLLLNLVYM